MVSSSDEDTAESLIHPATDMAAASMPIEHHYDLHGVRIAVTSCRGDVAAAIDRRLGRHRTDSEGSTDVSLAYVECLESTLGDAESRVVYATPAGDIHYSDAGQMLSAELLGTCMELAAGDGCARLAGGEWTGLQRHMVTQTLTTLALMELLRRRSRYPLHTAALARDGRGVLISGVSGAGKSTLALALARRGWDYLSDDLVFLDPEDVPLRVLGFADAVGVSPSTARLLPELSAVCSAPVQTGYRKHLLDVESLFATAVKVDCEPRLLVFPEIVPTARSRIEQIPSADGWLRLVPDVLLTDPVVTRTHLEAIARLIDQVRCYRLSSGADLESSVDLIESVL